MIYKLYSSFNDTLGMEMDVLLTPHQEFPKPALTEIVIRFQ